MKNTFRKLALLAGVSTAGLLSACGGGSADVAYGTLGVYLTDAPACGYDNVNVTVSKVRMHAAGDAGTSEAGWQEITLAPARKIDLLDLTNGVLDKLGEVELPAGRYTQLRLVLAPNNGANPLANSVVPTGGSETALVTPSAIQSGIKLNGNFEVAADSTTELALDFDACKSIVTRGNGSYGLKPVISIIPLATSGAISGVLDPAIAAAQNPLVSAQVDGVVVKSTVPQANGEFSLAPLPAGTYTVVVTADSSASDVIGDVPVTANGDTVLSTSAAPLTMEASAQNAISGIVTPPESEALVEAQQSFAAGPTVTIKYQNADVVTGNYALTLPAAAPRLGQYSSTLPIALTAEPAIAGSYAVRATATGYQPQSEAVDVSGGDATRDFALVPQ